MRIAERKVAREERRRRKEEERLVGGWLRAVCMVDCDGVWCLQCRLAEEEQQRQMMEKKLREAAAMKKREERRQAKEVRSLVVKSVRNSSVVCVREAILSLVINWCK